MASWPLFCLDSDTFQGWQDREEAYDPGWNENGVLVENPWNGNWRVDYTDANKCWIVYNNRKYKHIECDIGEQKLTCTTKNNIIDVYTYKLVVDSSQISTDYTEPESEHSEYSEKSEEESEEESEESEESEEESEESEPKYEPAEELTTINNTQHVMQPTKIKNILQLFYTKYNPDKLKNIDTIMELFTNREETLYSSLKNKYGEDPRILFKKQ